VHVSFISAKYYTHIYKTTTRSKAFCNFYLTEHVFP